LRSPKNFLILHSALDIRHSNSPKVKGQPVTSQPDEVGNAEGARNAPIDKSKKNTSPCATVTPFSSVIIGAVAGVIVVLAVLFFDRIKVDDPVGAISVHGVNGAWGTLAAGIFNIGGTSAKIIGVQVLGICAAFIWAFGVSFIIFKVIDKTIGLRVAPEEEREGLDLGEHGANAYPDFQTVTRGI